MAFFKAEKGLPTTFSKIYKRDCRGSDVIYECSFYLDINILIYNVLFTIFKTVHPHRSHQANLQRQNIVHLQSFLLFLLQPITAKRKIQRFSYYINYLKKHINNGTHS